MLAFLCLCLALVMLPAFLAVRKYITKSIKGLGLSAALLGLIAQFWYVRIYAPDNTPIGINYAVSIGAMSGSGSDKRVQVNFTMADAGSVPAFVLGSMMIVSGINHSSRLDTTLDVRPVYGNNPAFLFPGVIFRYDYVVRILKPGIDTLDFKLMVDFTRTTLLTLGGNIGNYPVSGCIQNSSDVLQQWSIVESHLRSFAQGAEVLRSTWCGYPENPKASPLIDAKIVSVRGGNPGPIRNQCSTVGDLGILCATREETIIPG